MSSLNFSIIGIRRLRVDRRIGAISKPHHVRKHRRITPVGGRLEVPSARGTSEIGYNELCQDRGVSLRWDLESEVVDGTRQSEHEEETVSRTRPQVAIVGVGATPYYPRGRSMPQTITQLAGTAILAACEDAGLSVRDIDGFAYYSGAGAGYG
jgi:hypothetical protein